MNKAVTNLKPEAEVSVDPLALLRKPFPSHQISKLPKPTKKQTEDLKANFKLGARCELCGGWHQPEVVHLDYVGHAALTDRLLDADPQWSWEPAAFGSDGLPLFDKNGGLWIRLTVCGVTRLGYGNAPAKPGAQRDGGDVVKEIIGDALRNAAMRFGAALDLWHKGDLHAGEETEGEPAPSAADAAIHVLRTFSDTKENFVETWTKNHKGWKDVMEPPEYARVVAVMKEIAAAFQAAEAAPPAPPPPPRKQQAPPPQATADAAFAIAEDEIPF